MSLKLFDIELSYQHLKSKLVTPASTKYKLLSINRFTSQILNEKDQSKYYSYYLDLHPILFEIIRVEKFNYISPDEFDAIITLISKLSKLPIFESNNNEFKDIIEILEIGKNNSIEICCGDTDKNRSNVEALFSDIIPIVLIEDSSERSSQNELEVGTVHELHLSSSLKPKSEKTDKIEFKNLVDINELEIVKHINKAVEIAKKIGSNQKIIIHHYNFTYYFDEKDYIYTGSSLGIGAFCLAYNSILINELINTYYKFRNDTVFTAEVDDDGNLVKLDNKSIEIKLKTVFFSPYKKFVIPEDNLIEAKSELAKLNEKYPKRNLELIPIRNQEQVFKNLDIVERCELRFKDKLAARYQRYHKVVNWVFSVLALLIIFHFVANYLIPHLDKNPVSYRFEDKHLMGINKYGLDIWKSDEMDEINLAELTTGGDKEHRVIIAKIDSGSTKNDIIFLNHSFNDLNANRSVFCYGTGNKPKWIYTIPSRTISYKDSNLNDNLILKGIRLLSHNSNINILYYGWFSDWFPFTIGVIDSKGNSFSEFWNSGYLNNVYLIDYNNDKNFEVFAGGCNNLENINCAALAVFDQDMISGASPFTDPIGDGKPGIEKYYIIFPKTIVWEYFKRPRNHVDQVKRDNNNHITAVVGEDETGDAAIFYEFDQEMNLLSAGPDDAFNIKLKYLVRENKITQEEADEYPTILTKRVQWWDGEKFVNNRAVNKWYIEGRNKK